MNPAEAVSFAARDLLCPRWPSLEILISHGKRIDRQR